MGSMAEYRRAIAERDLASVWPQWKIVRLLGTGAFGEVYEIQRNEYGSISRSALKILRKENEGVMPGSSYANIRRNNTAEEFVNTVIKEIDIMERLKGAPNIVGIEDYQVVRNSESCAVLIRMELLHNLDEYIASRNQITVSDAIRIGVDICNALEYCEGQNIIHRDVKESNIFYSDKGMFKLGDFGISKQLAGYVMNNATMTSAGTISKMAPEVYKGDKYDNRVDIYSLGVVLYSLLNYGRPPFYPFYPQNVTADDAYEADMMRIKGGTQIPPLQGVDRRLSNIVCKACSYKPSARYRTAAEFKDALLSYYEENIDGGTSTGGSGENGKIAVTAAGMVAIAAIIAAVVGLVVWYGGNNSSRPQTAYTESYEDSYEQTVEDGASVVDSSDNSSEVKETDGEEKHYLEPEEEEETEENYYSAGASGMSISQMQDYIQSSEGSGSTEVIDETTIALKNDSGTVVAKVEQPSWSSTYDLKKDENGGVYYYSGSGDRLCNIYYMDSVSSSTYVALLIDQINNNGSVSDKYSIVGDGSGSVGDNEVSWIELISNGENSVYSSVYWGAVSCDKGCIVIISAALSNDEVPEFSESEYLDDVACITKE